MAGEMVTVPMVSAAGTACGDASTRLGVSAPVGSRGAAGRTGVFAPHVPLPGLSQNFFTESFYLRPQNEAPAGARAEFLD